MPPAREPGTDGDALRRRSSGIGDPKVVLFVSLVEQLKLAFGIPGIVDYLRPVFCKNVAVKLPAWKGLGTLEELLRATGLVEVIPAEANSIELIEQADVVVCNGVSSVHAEAALMGRPTICLLDDQGLTVSEQRQKLRRLPNIYFHDYRARTAIPCSLYEQLAGQSFARGAQTVRLRAGRAHCSASIVNHARKSPLYESPDANSLNRATNAAARIETSGIAARSFPGEVAGANARQVAHAHQELVDGSRRFAPFVDGPTPPAIVRGGYRQRRIPPRRWPCSWHRT